MLTYLTLLCTAAVYSYPSRAHLILHLTSYEEMPVLDWACTFMSKYATGRHQRIQIQDLDRLGEADVKLLKNFLKGIRVTVSVPAGRRPARPIKDLVPNVGNFQFMKGDDETTIRVSFRSCGASHF